MLPSFQNVKRELVSPEALLAKIGSAPVLWKFHLRVWP
jgi:hypothetical protein